ncbi:MAG TPA: DUF4446 family protein [Candidatus Deferrimicrobiaceae bacterium]|nr:DUF4446 family protein [Candidatus Deferrimicrobiaceae bacterium]
MDLEALVQANLGAIVVGLAVAALLLLLLVVWLALRLRRLGRRLDALTRGADAASLEAVLGTHLERVRTAIEEVDRVAARTAVIERDLRSTLGRVGIVRFNPFEDTGGNQSFALAILDGHGDGFVISSLHARSGTRVYAKAISGGAAETALSDEEAEALRLALAMPAPGASA